MQAPAGRDEFPKRVRDELEARAGHKCSRPTCRAATGGPSDSRASGESNVGVAAHITAAAPGGPRYDPTLTAEQRQHADNGIWLCNNDAKIIDDDPQRYTRELLVVWREAADERAREEQARPISPDAGGSRKLVAYQRRLTGDRPALRRAVEEFLVDIGAPVSWGEHYEILRMAIYEIALNAMQHGGAKLVEIESRAGMVVIRDAGKRFGISDLTQNGRGGHQAVMDLLRHAAGSFALVYRVDNDENEWSFVDQIFTDGANTPCSVVAKGVGLNEITIAREELARLESCPEIHLYPGRLWSYSDFAMFLGGIGPSLGNRILVVHGVRRTSPLGRWLPSLIARIRLPD